MYPYTPQSPCSCKYVLSDNVYTSSPIEKKYAYHLDICCDVTKSTKNKNRSCNKVDMTCNKVDMTVDAKFPKDIFF